MLVKSIKRLGGLVVAVCKCGHLQCDHSSRTVPLGNKIFREYHHGGCVECSCRQFTFHRFMPLEDAATMLQDQRAVT
jgi:hypothetical protein